MSREADIRAAPSSDNPSIRVQALPDPEGLRIIADSDDGKACFSIGHGPSALLSYLTTGHVAIQASVRSSSPDDGAGRAAQFTRKSLNEGVMMLTATRCLCGFTELADETLTDHLLRVFTPADSQGPDGAVHDEGAVGTCLCGFSGPLDAHFLTVFTPRDAIAGDGREHQPAGTTG